MPAAFDLGDKHKISTEQELAVLDALSDGICVVIAQECEETQDTIFRLSFANHAFAKFAARSKSQLDDITLASLFPFDKHPQLHEATIAAYTAGHRQPIVFAWPQHGRNRQFHAELVPDTGIDGARRILIVLQRIVALDDSLAAQIDSLNVMKASRRDLEAEIIRLRGLLSKHAKAAFYDKTTGALSRNQFLERSGGEFQRCIRYGDALSLAMIRPREASDGALSALAQICESVCRDGVDIIGRTDENEIALLLPQTRLTGALFLLKRLERVASKNVLETLGGPVSLDLVYGADAVQADDFTVLQLFERTREALVANLR